MPSSGRHARIGMDYSIMPPSDALRYAHLELSTLNDQVRAAISGPEPTQVLFDVLRRVQHIGSATEIDTRSIAESLETLIRATQEEQNSDDVPPDTEDIIDEECNAFLRENIVVHHHADPDWEAIQTAPSDPAHPIDESITLRQYAERLDRERVERETVEQAYPEGSVEQEYPNPYDQELGVDLATPEMPSLEARPRPIRFIHTMGSSTGGTISRRNAMPDTVLVDSSIKQPRLLAAVTSKGELMFVRYEKGGNFHDLRERLGRRTEVWRIRKCPPHIAKRLIDFDKSEDADENRYKAWEYVLEAGFMLRQM